MSEDLMVSKELRSRCKMLSEKLSESVHVVDHDPSMALYRLQEHSNKTLPNLVQTKYKIMQTNSSLQGACFDLDNANQTIERMKNTIPTFEHIHEMLRNCLFYKQQLDYETSRSDMPTKEGNLNKSKSYHGSASRGKPSTN
uniref:BLOC-1-related complex subunit 8 n=1 Tax=Acrobeloides nanus TaxID=290746 RepID=A0A914EKU2_9BILA